MKFPSLALRASVRCASLLGLLLVIGCSHPQPSATAPAPLRVVSLTLATDELLPELVPLDQIAGITFLVDDAEISNVKGRYPTSTPRLKDSTPERVVALAPDLVCVAPYNSADFLKVIERSGLAAYRNEAVNSLDEIEAGIRALGVRVGAEEKGRELAERMHERRTKLAERLKAVKTRPRVLFWSAGFTAGSGSTIDDLIREAGCTNIAAERGLKGSAEISPEQVIAADPDYILTVNWLAGDGPVKIEDHPLLKNLRAVRDKRVVAIEGRYLLSISHYVMDGVERFAAAMHPDRFPPARETAP